MKRKHKSHQIKNSRKVVVEYYKTHIVEFIENELDVKLTKWQKIMINTFLKGLNNGKKFI